MHLRLQTLTLECRQSLEVVDLSAPISFFHGPIGTGKSSVARLIDFCLGGELERTPALRHEMVSAELLATLGEYQTLFERQQGASQIQVTWRNEAGETGTVLAPLDAGASPIWADNLFNLSDLIFFLMGVAPPMVRKSKQNADSRLIRLGFRDIMWYCYLKQETMEASFFRLAETFHQAKSRDVVRFVVGYYTERLNALDQQLADATEARNGKLSGAKQLRQFLSQHAFGRVDEIGQEIATTETELQQAVVEQAAVRAGHSNGSHFADALRNELRVLSAELDRERRSLAELDERMDEQDALRAELTSAKFKLARAEAASNVLSGVRFELCPACGQVAPHQAPDACNVCGQTSPQDEAALAPRLDAASRDLTARIEELQESLRRHTTARRKQEQRLATLQVNKAALDRQLAEELIAYDSTFLARFREVERRVATLQERRQNLKRLVRLPEAVATLEEEAARLAGDIELLRRAMDEERGTLTDAERRIDAIQDAYLEALLAVGFPGVENEDTVSLNRRTWVPSILSGGDPEEGWNYFDAGSGGKKTLLKVCYALAFHRIAREYHLPLLPLLIIDSPMKNISTVVNRDKFVAFYEYLFGLAAGPLAETQFIIIDNEYPDMAPEGLEIRERCLAADDPEHAPLISYYHGP